MSMPQQQQQQPQQQQPQGMTPGQPPGGQDSVQQQQQQQQAQQPAASANAAQAQLQAAARSKVPWTEHLDKNSGRTYYYNTVTRQSVWTKPPELAAAEEAAKAVAPDAVSLSMCAPLVR